MKIQRIILLFFIIIFIASATFTFLSYNIDHEFKGIKLIGDKWEFSIPSRITTLWDQANYFKKILFPFVFFQLFIVLVEYAQLFLLITSVIFIGSILITYNSHNIGWMLCGILALFTNFFAFGLNYAYLNFNDKSESNVQSVPYPSFFYYIIARISVSSIGAFSSAAIAQEFRFADIHFEYANEFIITISIIGLITGWLATRGLIEKVAITIAIFLGYKNNWKMYLKYAINLIALLALVNLIIMPFILKDVVFGAIGVPALIIAILTGIKSKNN